MTKPNSRLFCFDFDNTIVDGHFHNALFDMGVAPAKASKKQLDLLLKSHAILNEALLLQTFRSILSKGHHIAITTWSEYPEVIAPTLRKLGLNPEEIAQIHIESGIPSSLEGRKSNHIARAKQHFGITNNKNVFLIDDDELNILQAQHEGQVGIHVASPKTNKEYLQDIIKLIDKPTPRRSVRIASLNTQEGQRLFEVHQDLRAKGKRRQGIRQDGETPLARFLAKNPERAVPNDLKTSNANTNTLSAAEQIKKENKISPSTHYMIAVYQQNSIMLKKQILIAGLIGLSVAAILWFTSISVLTIIAASSFAFSVTMFIGKMQLGRLAKSADERSNDKNKWSTENSAAYDLGCSSAKAWVPYLKSYIHPKAYTAAFQVGLFESSVIQKKVALDAADSTPKPK